MQNYTILGREKRTGKYIVENIEAINEIEAKEEFLSMYVEIVYIQRVGLTNTTIHKSLEEYDVVEVVWPNFTKHNNKTKVGTEFVGATGVITEINHIELNGEKSRKFSLEFSVEFDYLNEGDKQLWRQDQLHLLLI